MPITNLAERLAATGITDFNKVMATLPLKEKVEVVRELQSLLMMEKQRLDEANGISDIVRGNTDPNETATAQQIKGNWASLRLAKKTGEVSRCFRDVFRIMSEVMAEHFTPQSWFLCTGMQVAPEVLQVLKSDMGRTLAIDVETDSTVALEDEAEKAQRLEFLNYVSPFIQQVLPAMAQGMLPADVGKELLKFALQSFKHGRSLEDAIEAAPGTAQQMQQMQQQTQEAQAGLQQTQQQMQQLQQALRQCQEALQKAEQDKVMGQMKAAQDQLKVAEQQFEVDKERAMMDMTSEHQRMQQEIVGETTEQNVDAQITETLAAIQQGIAEQSAATVQALEQVVMAIAPQPVMPNDVM
jgi:flagellar motor protein MotB